ncbi:Hsp70 family protein [Schlesneria paludicola]|uniref:Hsp70 family protein n=1 Tax=Schlesneria paludicola TaxID=360056 RepID=UPI000299D5DC|nr:Hsp70 family protein [Schlesneria paludicola]
MLPTHAVGIDLGTTYSCIAYLNEHGEPITIPNKDGELSTPSVVLFEGGEVIVGTEAMRNSIRSPDRVVVHAKRYMGNLGHRWKIAGKSYSPVEISTFILKSLLDSARERIGVVERAVITVPAQFSDSQRQATAEAGKRAGLKQVDIINEPVAAALCFVLGTEGIWFSELATAQTVMVVDLGGGTFDLSLVKYQKNEVSVIATGGDLHLGGLDWNNALETAIGKQFQKEFDVDPTRDRESSQALALEAEQTKRSLSVRPRAAMTVASGGHRKTYQIELEQFERLTKPLVDRVEKLTVGLLAERKMGWAKVDVVLTTGGSSRMPMIRSMLKRLSGRTLNTSLSPDQSIAHGATYYAGMLLTNNAFAKSILSSDASSRLSQFKQKSVNARALGVLVRDTELQQRVPHYLLPANTPLPASVSHIYGTVSDDQRRVGLRIVESGTAADSSFVELGLCQIEPLPENLPAETEIEVTITYDEQARVHVSAKVLATGQEARTEIIRTENLIVSAIQDAEESRAVEVPVADAMDEISHSRAQMPVVASEVSSRPVEPNLQAKPILKPTLAAKRGDTPGRKLASPILLCDDCGKILDAAGQCPACLSKSAPAVPPKPTGKSPESISAKPKISPRPIDKPNPLKLPAVPKPKAHAAAGHDMLDEDPSEKSRLMEMMLSDDSMPEIPIKPTGKSSKSRELDDSEFWRNLGQ